MFPKPRKYKSALITGASHGIGRSIALFLAREVDNLALLAKDHEVSVVAEHCRAFGAATVSDVADVTDARALKELIGKLDDKNPLDLVVCCAGISPVTATTARTERHKLMSELIDVNLLGSVATVDAILLRMIKRGHGQIALMSSIAAFVPTGDSPSYCASKSAVLAYGRSMRHRVRNHGVDFSVICPGYISTRLTEELDGRQVGMMSADDAARKAMKGLRRNRGIIAFPLKTYYFARFMASAPELIGNHLVDRYQYK